VAGSGSSLPAPRFVSSPTFFTCSFVASAEGAPAGGVWGSDILGSSHWGRNICALPGLTVLLRPCTGQRSFVQLNGGWACCSGLCRADHLGGQAGVHGGHHDDNDHGRPGQLRGHHRSPAVKPERARSGAILAEAGRLPVPAVLYGVWAARSGGSGALLRRRHGGLLLGGCVRFCSGAGLVDRALVVASPPVDGPGDPLLVEVALADARVHRRPGPCGRPRWTPPTPRTWTSTTCRSGRTPLLASPAGTPRVPGSRWVGRGGRGLVGRRYRWPGPGAGPPPGLTVPAPARPPG